MTTGSPADFGCAGMPMSRDCRGAIEPFSIPVRRVAGP